MSHSTIRIAKELGEFKRNADLSLAVDYKDSDICSLKAMIIGPHDTPYQFGFFEFAVKCPSEYPRKAPAVNFLTTNSGRCRFNPNIYSNGKVCLSILGTWRGESGEQWSAAQGLESILLSIQSLMSADPYENEPGYANVDASHALSKANYIKKIRHETIRLTVIQRLQEYLNLDVYDGCVQVTSHQIEDDEDISMTTFSKDDGPFQPFKDLCKRRFLWYYESYLATVAEAKPAVKPNEQFARMPFESKDNMMDGKFDYDDLEKRLHLVKKAIDDETMSWEKQGLRVAESTVGVNLRRQFEQILQSFKENNVPHHLQLVDTKNPFVWQLTYIGKPMTNLDNALINVVLRFSPHFPVEQPRVVVDAKLFHIRVAKDGTLCYATPNVHQDEVSAHIEAILAALDEVQPVYDPRTIVNPEAFKLYWGNESDRRTYNRRVRRSVQAMFE